ncbi:hypothetical protein EU534_02610, partial [Candidatus Heimdallarchaeota archaeon]
MTDLEKFKQRLIERENPPELITEAMTVLEDLHQFVQKRSKNISDINSNDFYDFSAKLIEEKQNKRLAYETLIGY